MKLTYNEMVLCEIALADYHRRAVDPLNPQFTQCYADLAAKIRNKLDDIDNLQDHAEDLIGDYCDA